MVDMVTRISTALKIGVGLACFASFCSAAGSIATVTSAEPFSVDGVMLSNPGVASWPLISNDTIATASSGALVTFRDGSAVRLAPQSRVKLAGSEAAPEVMIIAGNLDTKIAPGSKLLVTRANNTDKDAGTTATPSQSTDATTGARPNNNNTFRRLSFLYGASGASLAGIGLATDAVLQPAAVSTR